MEPSARIDYGARLILAASSGVRPNGEHGDPQRARRAHPSIAGALIVGAAYPDFDAGGLREAHRELLAADATGTPDPARVDAALGEFAEELKNLHPGGAERWPTLLRETAGMWLEYEGLTPEQVQAITTPVLVLAGDRDELISLELAISLYRALPDSELAICPSLTHEGPTPERAPIVASLIRSFAQRHSTRT